MKATQQLETYYGAIASKLKAKSKSIFVGKGIFESYKNENNLQHVKGKIYFKGLILKTL